MTFFNYLFQVNLFLALFIAFYWVLLRRETFFAQNRIYLNMSVLLSLVIPFIQSDWFKSLFITEQVRQLTYAVPVSVIYEPVPVSDATEAPVFSWAFVIAAVYLLGVLFFLSRFAAQLLSLRKHLELPAGGEAYSFFGRLFVAESLPDKEVIINHEKVHIRQLHSLDVIFIELMAILNWFNPIAYLYRNEIKHIHEFIADEEASGSDKQNYALLLLSQTLGITPHQLTNSFFNQSLLKRRIIMLGKNRSNRTGLLKYGLCAPLFATMLILSSATVANKADLSLTEGLNLAGDKQEQVRRSNNAFIARHPDVIGTRWSKNGFEFEVFLKDGKTLRYDLSNSADEAAAKQRFGTLPLASVGRSPESNRTNFDSSVQNVKTYVATSIKYPVKAREANTNGFVLLRFKATDGKVSDIQILYASDALFGQEATRVLKSFAGDIEDNTYSLAISFELSGMKNVSKPAEDPAVSGTKYLGEVVVTSYGKNQGSPQSPSQVPKSGSAQESQKLTVYNLPEVVASDKSVAMEQVSGIQDDKVVDFASVEVLPKFPGGDKGFTQFLSNNLQYPVAAKANHISGRVIVTFVVGKDGSLEDIKVLRGLGYGTDEEAVRVLSLSPKWSPGMQKGKLVRVQYTVPVFFQLPKKTE